MIFVVVTALPDLLGPTVDLVFPEPTVIPVLRDVTANQAPMELLVETALPERQVLTARPALKGPKVIKVEPETANVFAQESTLRAVLGGAEPYSAIALPFPPHKLGTDLLAYLS